MPGQSIWDLWRQSASGTDFLLTVFSSLVSLIPPTPPIFSSYGRRYVISATDSVVMSTENKQIIQSNAAQGDQRKVLTERRIGFPRDTQ
jgi:hypothetical protein